MSGSDGDERDERREIRYGNFVAWYFVILVSGVALAFGGEFVLGISYVRVIFFLCGILFLVAAGGRPRKLYLIVRSTGWFSFIEDRRTMHVLLFLMGVSLILLGFLGSDAQLLRVSR